MAKIVSIHSFRGGTGKSNTTANVATLLSLMGKRVGVIDTDIQSPGIHILFGMTGESVNVALNDYLWHPKTRWQQRWTPLSNPLQYQSRRNHTCLAGRI
jgi:MinD-like ATPase involved in chromosome partitioning or flagellar assembly